jgi:hypothetical protein
VFSPSTLDFLYKWNEFIVECVVKHQKSSSHTFLSLIECTNQKNQLQHENEGMQNSLEKKNIQREITQFFLLMNNNHKKRKMNAGMVLNLCIWYDIFWLCNVILKNWK